MLDYSITAPSPLPYHLGFMIGLAEEVSSSIVSESRSYDQFPPIKQFSTARIPPSLASAGPAGTVALEREQAVLTAASHTQEGECWTIA
jgi:hypothetical protein